MAALGVVHVLLENDTVVDARNNKGLTPPHVASATPGLHAYLSEHGANIHVQNKGQKPQHPLLAMS